MVRRATKFTVRYLACVLVAPTGRISIPDTIFCLNLALINYTANGIPAPNITWNSSLAERAVVHTPSDYLIGISSFVESMLEITAQREDNQISFCVTVENSVASTSQCYSRNVTCKDVVVWIVNNLICFN